MLQTLANQNNMRLNEKVSRKNEKGMGGRKVAARRKKENRWLNL
jgi:hypothetical protein